MPTGFTPYTLIRNDEEFDLDLEFLYSPLIPQTGPSWNDPGSPAEGGDIEWISAYDEDKQFPLTSDEETAAEHWLYANYSFDDEPYNPESP